MTTSPSPWVLDAHSTEIDADPVETAAAIAKAMRRLARETSSLATLDQQAPQITNELLNALRDMATVTTHLARLSFEHPAPSARDGDLGAFPPSSPAIRAANGFTEATHLIYRACQPLAGAQNETARSTSTTQPGLTPSTPDPGYSRREEPTHEPSL
ncbi:hypothetical protein [Promicromonospora sp. NPDC090134]|uniref:hypothetical protein n=1 Tax=Promicromonospora sp. NPDC090134 TaxID=3364408 RepID=UPI00381C7582